jgi:hypothetical protein
MAQQPQNLTGHGQFQLQYQDRPEVFETLADNLELVYVDGPTLRLVFSVNRIDPPTRPGPPMGGKKYTACRLVMPATALPQLAAQLTNLLKGSIVAPTSGAAN